MKVRYKIRLNPSFQTEMPVRIMEYYGGFQLSGFQLNIAIYYTNIPFWFFLFVPWSLQLGHFYYYLLFGISFGNANMAFSSIYCIPKLNNCSYNYVYGWVCYVHNLTQFKTRFIFIQVSNRWREEAHVSCLSLVVSRFKT